MTFKLPPLPLVGPHHGPASGAAPDSIVLLLHGLGANGDDLIGLAPIFANVMPNTLFLSPNAPQRFPAAPPGWPAYQWFPLNTFSQQEREDGILAAAPILADYIDAVIAGIGLSASKVALVGFSQGAMMSLYLAPRRTEQLAAVVGYSGALAHGAALRAERQSNPPVLLVHGDADPVVPVAALLDAVADLEAAGLSVQHHTRPGLQHGIDEEGMQLASRFLRRHLLGLLD
jgi:phospholipase/carboxylesterase